ADGQSAKAVSRPSHTPTSAVSFGISAKYQAMTWRALSASGDVQSRNSSHRTASAVFGTAPACASRSIAVRRDAHGGQHDGHVERLGSPGEEADIELRQGGARFRANGRKYLCLIVDQD